MKSPTLVGYQAGQNQREREKSVDKEAKTISDHLEVKHQPMERMTAAKKEKCRD
jgi:hypothetical protein